MERLKHELQFLWALITHQPYIPLSYAYVVSIAMYHAGTFTVDVRGVVAVVLFWLPFLMWELSRKIRAPGCETDYQTYSMVLGPRRAAGLCLGLALLTAGCGWYVFQPLEPSWLFSGAFGLAAAGTALAFLVFIIRPTERRSELEPVVSLFLLVLHLGTVLELTLGRII